MEQTRIVDEVARLVLDELPPPWDSAVLEFRALTTSAEDGLFVTHDGRQRKDFPPVESVDLLLELRQVMYVSGAGTWFSMELEITPDGRTATRFTYDAEPHWALVPDDATYVEDMRYPRLPEHQPDWPREKLSRGGALLEGRLDSAAWSGVRFEASFTHGGEPSGSLDFRPSPEADGWATEIAARLAAQEVAAQVGVDVDDESGVQFPVVRVEIGVGGYCSLAFWHEQVFWSVDVAGSQGDLDGGQRISTAVRQVVEAVTPWQFVDAKVTTPYERAIGLPAQH